jgi:hypothetical protein
MVGKLGEQSVDEGKFQRKRETVALKDLTEHISRVAGLSREIRDMQRLQRNLTKRGPARKDLTEPCFPVPVRSCFVRLEFR